MNLDDATEIIKQFFTMDFAKLNMREQIIGMEAVRKFAEELRPIVMKYAIEKPIKSTFFMKLGDD